MGKSKKEDCGKKSRKKSAPKKRSKSNHRLMKSKCCDKKKESVTKTRVCAKSEPIYEKFYDLDEIKEYLCGLVAKYPTRINVRIIGESAQGRPILMTYISENDKSDNQKNITMVEAGSNGADYYSISSALYLIDFLIKNPNFNALMDYIVIPCSNPDGYLYCLNNEGNGKVPVDLSHNFPLSHLGWSDLSRIQDHEFLKKVETWKKNYKFNAPETKALNKVLCTYHVAIKLLISLQEGGDKILFPFGCCDTKLEDEYEVLKVATSGAAGFKKKCVSVGSIYNCCGLTYGSLIDFIRFEQSAIKFMYIIHLFKKGTHPICAEKIKEYGECVANCVRNMSKTVYMLDKKGKPDVKVENCT